MNLESSSSDPLTADDAVDLLGIKRQTLYAYVARGWIRAITQPGRKQKLYMREDVERVRLRSQARASGGSSAAAALHWGEPVVSTAITEITPEGPRYRGRLATDIARARVPFEATAELLWTGTWQEQASGWITSPPPDEFWRGVSAMRPGPVHSYTDRLAATMHLLADAHAGQAETLLGSLLPPARQAIQVAAAALGYLSEGGTLVTSHPKECVASIAARALGKPNNVGLMEALDVALTLTADHELPPSTFIARIVASTGSGIHACLAAGISGFYGSLTGAGTDSVEELILTSTSNAALMQRFQRLVEQRRELVGFNHPLYPDGDPRARFLLDYVHAYHRNSRTDMLVEFVHEAERQFGVRPAQAVGLVAVQVAFDLPRRTASALNLLGRLAGMVAHVQEQRLTPALIRPRARYTGS